MTFDRPGVAALADGTAEVAWDSTDSVGEVYVADFTTNGTEVSGTRFHAVKSSTFEGTGPKVALDANQNLLVAWTDVDQRVHIGKIADGIICGDLPTSVTSIYSPYLTLAADGSMYLTAVGADGVINVGRVDDSTCQDRTGHVTVGPVSAIPGAATSVGPALEELNPYTAGVVGVPNLLLAWADRTSAQTIWYATFDPANDSLSRQVDAQVSTKTDLGASSSIHGLGAVTYCSSEGAVSALEVAPGAVPGGSGSTASCMVHTTPQLFISGGIDTSGPFEAYADPNKNLIVSS